VNKVFQIIFIIIVIIINILTADRYTRTRMQKCLNTIVFSWQCVAALYEFEAMQYEISCIPQYVLLLLVSFSRV